MVAFLLPALPCCCPADAGLPTAGRWWWCWPAFLLACWLGSRLQLTRNQAGNPNPGNGIPGIRILAHRTRIAFGFGIPPYDLLIPREIQKTNGYARTSQSHHHVCHCLITTSANVCQHQITTSGHQGVVRKHMERQKIDGREPEPTGANRSKQEQTGANKRQAGTKPKNVGQNRINQQQNQGREYGRVDQYRYGYKYEYLSLYFSRRGNGCELEDG